jgi:hypothetical protein
MKIKMRKKMKSRIRSTMQAASQRVVPATPSPDLHGPLYPAIFFGTVNE